MIYASGTSHFIMLSLNLHIKLLILNNIRVLILLSVLEIINNFKSIVYANWAKLVH